jgi:hypothetical protein
MPIKYYTPTLDKAVKDHHIDFRVRGRLPETYDLQWVDKRHPCKTGCWRFDHASGRHEIRLSVICYDTLTKGGAAHGKRVAVPDLYRNVYEHEAAHSLYTTKDLEGLGKILAAEKIPWRLMNLFEDCRIERNWILRERAGKSFRWTRWEEHPPVSKMSASSLLFHMKTEGLTRSGYRFPRSFIIAHRTHPNWRKVYDYYRRIVGCGGTEDLVPILKDWLKDFPATGDDTIEGEGGAGTGDMGEAIGEATGTHPKDVKAKDPKGEGASPETKSGGGKGKGGKAPGTRAESTKSPTHGRGSGGTASEVVPTIDHETERSLRLAQLLAQAFRKNGVIAKGPTARPSKRLNLRGLLRGDWSRPFVGKTIGNTNKPHISFVMDCSGSMGCLTHLDRSRKVALRTDDCGRILARALNELARLGHITGVVYGSSDGGCHSRTELPVPDHVLTMDAGLEAFSGSEGIGLTLAPGCKPGCYTKKGSGSFFEEIAAKSKIAIVYTDGCITDAPVNRMPLRARGVYTIGAYAGPDKTAALRHHFDYVISRDSLWGVADALVRTLKSIPRK